MKLKISRVSPVSAETKGPKPCVACAGEGFYDWRDPRTGRQPKCDACGGTGLEEAQKHKVSAQILN